MTPPATDPPKRGFPQACRELWQEVRADPVMRRNTFRILAVVVPGVSMLLLEIVVLIIIAPALLGFIWVAVLAWQQPRGKRMRRGLGVLFLWFGYSKAYDAASSSLTGVSSAPWWLPAWVAGSVLIGFACAAMFTVQDNREERHDSRRP